MPVRFGPGKIARIAASPLPSVFIGVHPWLSNSCFGIRAKSCFLGFLPTKFPEYPIAVVTSYGWEGGESGRFDDARTKSLANQAATATPGIPNAAHRCPAQLLTLNAA